MEQIKSIIQMQSIATSKYDDQNSLFNLGMTVHGIRTSF